uniref:Uncharacterized protein n=1 Tax=Anopheles farauti TaxID=69004 RepID=A0A182QVN2_9DIPT
MTMFTVGGARGNDGRGTGRGANRITIRYGGRWTAGMLGLVLLVLLQLESQVQFQTVAVTPDDTAWSGTSSSSAASAQSSSSTSPLMDGIVLDEDGVLLSPGQQTLSEEAATHLLFHPRHLNFAERSIGDPHNQPVVLFNRHKNRSVYLGTISGSTADYSSSYFKEKVIPPGGNTSFNVVFLPRKLGPSDGSLLVHTSFGMVRYPVRGEGTECPYRLRPLVGLQAPLNATLSPEITLYNPHDTPLQIVEVYSSGGNFQLELPSGAQEGPQTLWEIPPHSTRTVIRVRFHARTPGHHLAYVRIKISGGAANPALVDKMLVVPIEVEIAKETGLYARIPFLELGVTSSLLEVGSTPSAATALAAPVEDREFGLSVRSGRNVTRLSLDLSNSGSEPVRVKSWGVQADDIESVLFMHVVVVEERTLHVEFDWSKLTSDRRHISGRILLNLERILSSGEQSPGEEDELEEDGEQHDGSPTGMSRGGETAAPTCSSRAEMEEESGEDCARRYGKVVVPTIYSIPFAGEVLKGSIQYNEEALRFLLPTEEREREEQDREKEDALGGGGGSVGVGSRGRPLVIRNHFYVPLSITNISVPENCTRHFTIEGFRPVVLQPNDERTLLRIARKPRNGGGTLPLAITTSIRLATNISDYELPVLGYSGRLVRLLSPTVRDASLLTPTAFGGTMAQEDGGQEQSTSELDFGVLPIATIGEALVAFRNPNPVPIPIIHWKGAITSEAAVGAPTITVILRGCGPLRLDGLVFCHTVQPGEWIVYQISVQSGTIDSYQGRFTVKTDYEEIVTPLRFTTAVGELHLMRERLRFDDCFPGKLCTVSLLAASSFPNKIQIESIRSDVPGLSYEFLSPDKQRPLAPNQPVALYPDTVTSIGRLTLDPKAHCGGGIGGGSAASSSDCYSSFDLLSKPFGVKWMATLDCYEQYRRLDSDKLLQQLQRYAEMRQRLTSVHFQVLAESSRRFDFNASVGLVWPKLLDENVFFPTLQVEQEAVRLITINNPSDQILFVHLVLHDVAVHGRTPIVDSGGGGGGGGGAAASATAAGSAINLPPEVLTACDNCSLSEESVFSFFLFDSDDIYVNYVKPQSFLRIAVKFSARLPGTYSTVLYMRNNLTLIDAAWIQARAVVPQFKFGNRRPGSPTALQFEITDKHVQPCYKRDAQGMRQEAKYDDSSTSTTTTTTDTTDTGTDKGTDTSTAPEQPDDSFVVETKRTFTARNYGEVPILISGIRIEEMPCEGFGFKVLDCAPFELAPNASRKIEIAFAPDFTLSRVLRVLHFDTNINQFPVNFTLLGTVPMQHLDMCSRSLPRPWFEYWFRALLFIALPSALFGTLVAAVLESNRVLRIHFLSLVREKGPLQPPLDLRQIALQHSTGGGTVDAGGTGGTAGKERDMRANQNGGAVGVSSRNNRSKSDRKNGTHAKGGGGVQQQQQQHQHQQQNGTSSVSESASSRFNRSWTDFTAKLGVTVKPSAGSTIGGSSGSSPVDGSRTAQTAPQTSLTKSRRSITPPKQQQPSGSELTNGSSGPTKEKIKSSPSSGVPSPAAEAAAAKPTKAGSSTNGGGGTTTSDLTGVLESNSTASKKQHHHSTSSSSSSSSSSSAAEDTVPEGRRMSSTASSSLSSISSASSSSSSASSSTVSSSSSSPSPTSKQQSAKQQHPASSAAATTKTNVKKTKSLPVSYESVVVSLASVFAVASSSYTTSQKSVTEVSAATLVAPTSTVAASSPVSTARETASKQRSVAAEKGPASSTNGKQLVQDGSEASTTKAATTTTHASTNKPSPLESVAGGKSASSERVNTCVGGTGAGTLTDGKENSIISSGYEKPTAGNGNVQHETLLLQHQQQQQPPSASSSSSSSKKFSKTPGRERKPNQSKKGTNGKGQTAAGAGGAPQYKGTGLQFNTLAQQQHKSTVLGTILQNASIPVPSSTAWGENCARFSDVVAQTPSASKLSGGTSQLPSSTLLSMDLLVGLGGSNRAEQKSKDDSYLSGGRLEKEYSSAPFIATSASPDLGPIGTSKKSPSGGTNGGSEGDGEGETDGMMLGHRNATLAGRSAAASVTKCWEPFGGHVIHNPTQLAAGGGGEANATHKSLANGSGGPHQSSDSFFSQSFADFHHRSNDQYRGVASMAGGSNGTMDGMTTTSSMLLSHARSYNDHSAGHSNGGSNQHGTVGENDFIDTSRHQQQLHGQRDWGVGGGTSSGLMNGHLHWTISTHKPTLASIWAPVNNIDLWAAGNAGAAPGDES